MINILLYITCLDCLYVNIADGKGYNFGTACPACGGRLQIQKYDITTISSYEQLRAFHREILKLWSEARTRHDHEIDRYIRVGTPPVDIENIEPITMAALEKINSLNLHVELVGDFMHQSVYPKYAEFPNPELK